MKIFLDEYKTVSINQFEYDVVLASCNGEKFIEAQIESILRQTNLPKTIIVSDDNSTDQTCSIVERIVDSNVEIKLLTNNNRVGFVKNFERGLAHAISEITFFADQDDYWMPEKAERVLKEFESFPSAVVVATNAALGDEELTVIGSLHENPGGWPTSGSVLGHSSFTGATMAVKTDFLRDECLPFFDEIPHDMWMAVMAARNGRLRYLDERLIIYRQHSDNVIGANSGHFVRRVARAMSISAVKRRCSSVERQVVLLALTESLVRWSDAQKALVAAYRKLYFGIGGTTTLECFILVGKQGAIKFFISAYDVFVIRLCRNNL